MKNYNASENQATRRILLIACATALAGAFTVSLAAQGSKNGAAGQMPAFYDGELFTINLKELSDTASDSVVFNEGFTPHQFFSDDEVLAAAAGANPEITLVDTGEVYRCSVVGPKLR